MGVQPLSETSKKISPWVILVVGRGVIEYGSQIYMEHQASAEA